jgi:SAM-dependent methyltransferase
MYSNSKENGGIVGRIQAGNQAVDFGDVAENTGCEESLVCEDADGNPMTLSSFLDPSSGALAWAPEPDEEAVAARVLGCNLMPSMLHDADRNRVYEASITRLISHFIEVEGRAPSVLDVGCGTGLLSMMAARAGAEHVIGCEMFDTMASVAQDVVLENGMSSQIDIYNAKSTDIELPAASKADVLVSELLDSALLGESVMFSHADAVQRLIKPQRRSLAENRDEEQIDEGRTKEGKEDEDEELRPASHVQDRVIPHRGELYCTLVSGRELSAMHSVDDISFGVEKVGAATPWRNAWAADCAGGWPLVPVHWTSLQDRARASEGPAAAPSSPTFLEMSAAHTVLSFDFYHSNLDESVRDRCCETDIVVTQVSGEDDGAVGVGTATGLLLYWKVWMLSPNIDPLQELFYSTKPGDMNWQDHWVQVVCPLPRALVCKKGDVVRVTCHHDNLRIWCKSAVISSTSSMAAALPVSPSLKRLKSETEVGLSAAAAKNQTWRDCSDGDDLSPVECTCGWHLLHSSDRLLMLNDKYRRSAYEEAVKAAVRQIVSSLQSEMKVPVPALGLSGEGAEASASVGVGGLGYYPLILDVADGSVLGLTAAHFLNSFVMSGSVSTAAAAKACRVVSRETKAMSELFYSQLAEANGLPHIFSTWAGGDLSELQDFFVSDEESESDSELPQENASATSGAAVKGAEVEEEEEQLPVRIVALLSDCYQYQLQARQVWQAISYHYQRSSLQSLLSLNAVIVPARAYVMVAALQLTDLHVNHGNVGTVSGAGGGYDHSAFDVKQRGWHTHWLPYKLSDYRTSVLAGPAVAQVIDFTRIACDLPALEITMPVTEVGRCDCVAVWVDYDTFTASSVYEGIRLEGGRGQGQGKEGMRHLHMQDGRFPPYLKVNIRLFETPENVIVSGAGGTHLHATVDGRAPVDGKRAVVCKTSFQIGDSDLRYDFSLI